jgi:hypothetical protein
MGIGEELPAGVVPVVMKSLFFRTCPRESKEAGASVLVGLGSER